MKTQFHFSRCTEWRNASFRKYFRSFLAGVCNRTFRHRPAGLLSWNAPIEPLTAIMNEHDLQLREVRLAAVIDARQSDSAE
jgi:hypothetical protein